MKNKFSFESVGCFLTIGLFLFLIISAVIGSISDFIDFFKKDDPKIESTPKPKNIAEFTSEDLNMPILSEMISSIEKPYYLIEIQDKLKGQSSIILFRSRCDIVRHNNKVFVTGSDQDCRYAIEISESQKDYLIERTKLLSEDGYSSDFEAAIIFDILSISPAVTYSADYQDDIELGFDAWIDDNTYCFVYGKCTDIVSYINE